MPDILTTEQVAMLRERSTYVGLTDNYAQPLCASHEALRTALASASQAALRLRDQLAAMSEERDMYRDAMNAEARLRKDYGAPEIRVATTSEES